jgi:hypothetical protein
MSATPYIHEHATSGGLMRETLVHARQSERGVVRMEDGMSCANVLYTLLQG